MNAPLETIPDHLREYITEQDPSLYTPIDHAVWRYVMRVSKFFFAKHGHPLYLQGLLTTGISIDQIPLISDMDEALRKLGWRAVAINGFIPPSVFLEFQSLRILAIACDIRKLENIGYTPSPDIIHEAAGHVPIIADPNYRAYLEAYGEVARNAVITKYDLDLYDAIYKLSEIKEDPHADANAVKAAQAYFDEIAKLEKKPSEAALLARMAWWTTEYGLIEHQGVPLIYGAGLLSSISESYNYLNPAVKKLPFDLQTSIKTPYDITQPQPQLFVAKSFQSLTTALDQFANTMAFRRGGVYGLQVAQESENTATAVFDNGVQVSGIIKGFTSTDGKAVDTFTITGHKQFAAHDKATEQIQQFSLGNDILFPLFNPSIFDNDIESIKRKLHGSGLHTLSGLRVTGRFKKEIQLGDRGKILILERAKIVDSNEKVIFEENQKLYPLILGSKITSVFGGAADRTAYLLRNRAPVQKVKSHKSNLTPENTSLNFLYRKVREYRESKETNLRYLDTVLNQLNQYFPDDWLLRLEMYEVYRMQEPNSVIAAQLHRALSDIAERKKDLKDMIERGIEIL